MRKKWKSKKNAASMVEQYEKELQEPLVKLLLSKGRINL